MDDVKQGYRTGRAVVGAATLAGWLVAVAGTVVAGVGLVSVLRADDAFSAMPQMAAISAGLGLALWGVVAVALAQSIRANFDTADMTREMLTLARRRPPTAAAVMAASPPGPTPAVAPRPALDARPTLARPRDGGGKVHPIFSARPPRQPAGDHPET